MIEGYNSEKVIECCQEYLKVQRGIGNPDSHHKGRLAGKGTSGKKVFIDHDYKEVSRSHYSVLQSALQSTTLLQPYIKEHMATITTERNGCSDDWVIKQHKQRLTLWLKDQNILPGETIDSTTISRLAEGPSRQVTS
jgi:hypothetical protein